MVKAASGVREILLGLVLGGIASASLWTFYPGFWKVPASAVVDAARARREALRQQFEARSVRERPSVSAPAAAPMFAAEVEARAEAVPEQSLATAVPLSAGRVGAASGAADGVAEVERTQLTALLPSDEELAQLDDDIARLREQARSVTDDPAGMRKRSERALQRRDACPDRACLLRWYAQRRRELLQEF